MEVVRWIAAGICLSFFAMCLVITAAVGIRWLRTGRTGSGLPIVGSLAGFVGLLVAPVGTLSERLPYAFLPAGLELLLFLAGWAAGNLRRPDR